MKLTMKVEGAANQTPDQWGACYSGGPIKPFELAMETDDIETLLALVETSIENSVDTLPEIKARREEVEDLRRIGNDRAQQAIKANEETATWKSTARDTATKNRILAEEKAVVEVNLAKTASALGEQTEKLLEAKFIIGEFQEMVAGSGLRYPRGLRARIKELVR